MFYLFRLFYFFIFILFFLLYQSEFVFSGNVISTRIVSDYDQIKYGDSFKVGIEFNIPKGWHLYWINPGSVGYPPQVNWHTLDFLSVSKPHFPYPEEFIFNNILSYGYKDSLFLPFHFDWTFSPSSNVTFINLSAKVKWLACKDVCVPESTFLSLQMNKGDDSFINRQHHYMFVDSFNKIPKPNSFFSLHTSSSDHKAFIHFSSEIFDTSLIESIQFFPLSNVDKPFIVNQIFQKRDNHYFIEIPLKDFPDNISELDGVFVVKFLDNRPPLTFKDRLTFSTFSEPSQFYKWIFFAFLGGLILNIMPCVFPVLSLKIFHFLEQATIESKVNKAVLRSYGIYYSLGIVSLFLFFGLCVLFLNGLGYSFGWGFQLQSPLFVYFMSLLFFLLGLNLLGFFEMGLFFARITSFSNVNNGNLGAFLGGLFTTLVATPCTAPFMGAALGIALLSNWFLAVSIFVFLGIGMAFPYLILSFFPSWALLLPRPGQWMVSFKEFLSFPMFLTVLWLVQVIYKQSDILLVILLLSSFIFIVFSIWIVKRSIFQGLSVLVSFLIILVSISLPIYFLYFNSEPDKLIWQRYSKAVLSQSLSMNKQVFINFTADWCVTCKFNERFILNSNKVRQFFHENGVVLLKADWTSKDSMITSTIQSYGKLGVPLYVFYDTDIDNPIILPELLTKNSLLDYLSQ